MQQRKQVNNCPYVSKENVKTLAHKYEIFSLRHRKIYRPLPFISLLYSGFCDFLGQMKISKQILSQFEPFC